MISLDYIKKELRSIYDSIVGINIRYEYSEISSTHIIEVTPIEIYNDVTYVTKEIKLFKEFSSLYPDEEILFISSESLSTISNPILNLSSNKSDLDEKYPYSIYKPNPIAYITNESYSNINLSLAA